MMIKIKSAGDGKSRDALFTEDCFRSSAAGAEVRSISCFVDRDFCVRKAGSQHCHFVLVRPGASTLNIMRGEKGGRSFQCLQVPMIDFSESSQGL